MKMAYIRVSKAHPREAQEVALRSVGFTRFTDSDPVYVDAAPRRKQQPEDVVLEERARVIHACRVGHDDEVWIASPGIWGTTQKDAMEALAKLTARGAVLCVVSTGGRYRWHEDAAQALELAAAIAAENQNAATAAARAAAAKRRERKAVETAAAWKEAARLWKDDAVTVADAAKRTGLAVRTLYRKLGPKGTAPFVGGPGKKAKRRPKR